MSFLEFIKKSNKRIIELLFTHLISLVGLIGFLMEGWFQSGGVTFHNIMVVLALLVLSGVPPLSWYRNYTIYKRVKKYRDGDRK